MDLAYASQNLVPFIKGVVIDSSKKFTPRSVVWRNNAFTSVYTDHFPVEVVLSGMPRKNYDKSQYLRSKSLRYPIPFYFLLLSFISVYSILLAFSLMPLIT